ncbi:lipid droplet-associated perilipin protein [Pholiota conissans]|uniref:Lipid droplet-associated perilipin protein n=1 Tax=Pholiota conissans TaxID=109636 RepID=A0A9P6CYW3_9AGAR|nr:lipid droplet-associated perilipin protein [Pholiota conissans]
MISSSLTTLNEALSNNSYTRSPYAHAKELSISAYKLTEPLQVQLAPLIVRADGYANKAVDAVESRYPYPFKAQPEEVVTLVRERRESTTNYVTERVNDVNKAIDAKVKTPALNVAHDIDQRFAPIVDYFAVAVSRLNSSEAGPSTPPDAQYQYQRALALSKTLRENIYEFSNEQLKQFQAQSVIAQKASETAHSISAVASSSLANAQTRIHTLSDTMLAELQKLQTSTTELSASLQNTLSNSATQFQSQVPQIQQSYADLTAAISATVNELSTIITTKDLPVQEKVTRVSKEVQDRVHPLLEAVKKGVSEVLSRVKPTEETKESDKPMVNGNGTNGHAPSE